VLDFTDAELERLKIAYNHQRIFRTWNGTGPELDTAGALALLVALDRMGWLRSPAERSASAR